MHTCLAHILIRIISIVISESFLIVYKSENMIGRLLALELRFLGRLKENEFQVECAK